jgi:iron(III) transport system ATP-binding protein
MFLGTIAEYRVALDGIGEWLVDCSNPAETRLCRAGDAVFLTPSPSSIHVLK